jgi:putative flippase GtrA
MGARAAVRPVLGRCQGYKDRPRQMEMLLTIELGRLVRYGLTGTLAALAYAGVTTLLIESGLARPIAATIFGYFTAATISYLGHLYFSFRVQPDHQTFLWRFGVTVAMTFAVTTLTTYVITGYLSGSYGFSIAAVAALIPMMNYLCNRFWVFLPALRAQPDCMRSHSDSATRPD